MTVQQAITHIDAVKPNVYTTADKIAWLNTLDGKVKNDILDFYATEVDWDGYDAEHMSEELLVPAPYDTIYEHYMAGEIDRLNEEIDLYNNDVALFNSDWSAFRNYYNRNNEHKRARVILI